MANITRAITKTFKYEGDDVIIVARRLLREDMIELAPHIKDDKATFNDALQFWSVAGPVLKRRITSVVGLTLDGAPATPEDFSEEFSLYTLAMDVLNWVLSESSLGGKEAKKSEAASSDASTVIPETT